MPSSINHLRQQRVIAVDAFRGITFLLMIFVNTLAGVGGISRWLKHMPADADAMSFPDLIFPAFLFIVGMSIPFAIQSRIAKGGSMLQLQGHILYRALSLVLIGVFMVNAEDGYNEAAMPIPILLWSLIFYAAIGLCWGVYRFADHRVTYALRGLGVLIIIALATIFCSGVDGKGWLTPQWWGILGLIGWAYLLGSLLYQCAKGKIATLVVMLSVCVAYYTLTQLPALNENVALSWFFSQPGNIAHTSIVLAGIICSLIFFDTARPDSNSRRYREAGILLFGLAVAAFLLRPYYKISKIYATPSWCMYCAAICIAAFGLLYYSIDIRKHVSWTNFVQAAAANPLVTYFIPFAVDALLGLLKLQPPAALMQGMPGVGYSLAFSLVVLGAVSILNKYNFKLRL